MFTEYKPKARRSFCTQSECNDHEPNDQERMKNTSLSAATYIHKQQHHVVDNIYHDHLRQPVHSYNSQLQHNRHSHDGLLHQNHIMQMHDHEHDQHNFEYQRRKDQRYPHQLQHQNNDKQRQHQAGQKRRERHVSFEKSALHSDDE